MAIGGNRRIEVDIIANDRSSRVFDHVASSMQSMSVRVNNSITSINNGLDRYNNAMAGMYRSTQLAVAGAGYLVYRFTKDSVSAFAEFERQHGKTMGAIASNYDKTAEAQRRFIEDQKKLRDQSIKLGTIGPDGTGSLYNPTQVSYSQTALSKAGIKSEDIATSIPYILKFAGGNDLGLETATEYAVNLGNMFKIPINQWENMLDKVTRTADVSTVDVPDIFETLKYAGPIASSMGRSLDETLAMIAVMGNVGLKGSIAGTGIQSFYTRLLSPIGKSEQAMNTAPTEYAQAALSSFIDYTTDETGKFKDVPTVTEKMDEVMNTLNDKEQAWFAHKLFGLFQMKAGYTLAENGGDNLRAVASDITNNAPGTNDRKWDIMLETAWGRQMAYQNAMQGIKTDVGSRLSPITNAIYDELFKILSNNGNYDIDFGYLKDALNDAGDLISEQYGNQLGEMVKSIGNLGLDGSRIFAANEPLLEGFTTGIFKLLGGDVSGAIEEMSTSIQRANKNIDDLPPELITLGRQAKNAALALMALAGINFAARLLENITTIWRYTIGSVIKTANMNVTAANVVLKDTGILDKNGNPIYKQGPDDGKGGKGGKGGGTGTGGGVLLGKNGKPISSGGTTSPPQSGDKPVFVDKNGNPITTGTGPSQPGSSSMKGRLSMGFNTLSWAYAIGEMLGINDKLLDSAGVDGNARENVDKVRTGLNLAFTGSFVDDILLKGAGKQMIRKIGSGIATGASQAIAASGIGTIGAAIGGTIVTALLAGLIKEKSNNDNRRENMDTMMSDTSGDRYIIGPKNNPWWDPNGIITDDGNNMVNMDKVLRDAQNDPNPDRFAIQQRVSTWDKIKSFFTGGVAEGPVAVSTNGIQQTSFTDTMRQLDTMARRIQSPIVNVSAPNVNVDVRVDKNGNVAVDKYIPSVGPTLDNLYRLQKSRVGGMAP